MRNAASALILSIARTRGAPSEAGALQEVTWLSNCLELKAVGYDLKFCTKFLGCF